MSVIYFLLLVGLLVAIHEFGHFVAAKLLDFEVQRFSIGFGRPLIRLRGARTEYQIAILPLGGYVRILGEDPNDHIPPELASRTFHAKPLWQRLIVVFAGPAANLVFPILIYFVFFAGHTQLPAAVIGDVLDHSPAQRAGIQPGDRITAINNQPVRYWEQVEGLIRSHVGEEIRMQVERRAKRFERYLIPMESSVRNREGLVQRAGLVGITHAPFLPIVGIIDPHSPAAKAGLQTGDLIVSINGDPIANWTELEQRLGRRAHPVNVAYFRSTPIGKIPQLRLLRGNIADLVPDTRTGVTGLAPAEMLVARVTPGSPADVAGLHPGDLITHLDEEPIAHWMTLDQRLQSKPGHTFTIRWRRRLPSNREKGHAKPSV